MSICWYCHWGWPKQIADIYDAAIEKLDGYDYPMLYGPAHIVWSDENFDCADSCLETFEIYRGDYTDEQLEVVRWSLLELKKLPPEILDCVPGDYDDDHPENYPPPDGWVMLKR